VTRRSIASVQLTYSSWLMPLAPLHLVHLSHPRPKSSDSNWGFFDPLPRTFDRGGSSDAAAHPERFVDTPAKNISSFAPKIEKSYFQIDENHDFGGSSSSTRCLKIARLERSCLELALTFLVGTLKQRYLELGRTEQCSYWHQWPSPSGTISR
jgi:hypothetical protein